MLHCRSPNRTITDKMKYDYIYYLMLIDDVQNENIIHKYFGYWLKQYKCTAWLFLRNISWKKINFQSSVWFTNNIYNYFVSRLLQTFRNLQYQYGGRSRDNKNGGDRFIDYWIVYMMNNIFVLQHFNSCHNTIYNDIWLPNKIL